MKAGDQTKITSTLMTPHFCNTQLCNIMSSFLSVGFVHYIMGSGCGLLTLQLDGIESTGGVKAGPVYARTSQQNSLVYHGQDLGKIW